MKFAIKDFFSICDQIHSFLWIWSHLPEDILRFFFSEIKLVLARAYSRG